MTFDEERLTGVGGSDAAAVLGISPWATPYDVYLQKLGQAPPPAGNEPMLWGTLLEPVIRDEYARRTGRAVETLPMLRHPTLEFMIAHLDGQIRRTDAADAKRILEIKTARTSHGWGEPGTDEIPLQYLLQVHHYLVVSGAQIADLAVLIGGQDFRLYEVHADADIARELVAAEYAFWHQVACREPPAPSNTQDAIRRWGGWLRQAGLSLARPICSRSSACCRSANNASSSTTTTTRRGSSSCRRWASAATTSWTRPARCSRRGGSTRAAKPTPSTRASRSAAFC